MVGCRALFLDGLGADSHFVKRGDRAVVIRLLIGAGNQVTVPAWSDELRSGSSQDSPSPEPSRPGSFGGHHVREWLPAKHRRSEGSADMPRTGPENHL